MKYLLSLLFLVIPFYSFSDAAVEKKFSLTIEAEKHKQEGIKALFEVGSLCYLIPDLGKREHMHAIITSAISAVAIPEPKLKVLAVGISLLGSFAVDSYDTYCKCKTELANAAYHFEMANFYHSISYKISDLIEDEGTKAFLLGIDSLTMCDMLSSLIKDGVYIPAKPFDLKKHMAAEILSYRNYFIEKFKKSNGKLTKKISEEVFTFYENFEEIISELGGDFDDEDITSQMQIKIGQAGEYFEKAEKIWGIY